MSEKIKEVFVNDDIIKQWYEKAKHVNNVEQLKEFIEYVYSSGICDYNSCVDAVTAITIASSWCANEHYKLTGFQASFVGLRYLIHWTYDYRNTVGISVRDYTDMLYPQCAYKFEKKINKEVFNALQKKAKEKLEEGGAHPIVRDHWQSIVDGVVPFGYELVDNVF